MAHVVPSLNLVRSHAEPLLAAIGNTPLIRLEKVSALYPGVEILGKAEFFNPGGSVKDPAPTRPDAGNVPQGEEQARLQTHECSLPCPDAIHNRMALPVKRESSFTV